MHLLTGPSLVHIPSCNWFVIGNLLNNNRPSFIRQEGTILSWKKMRFSLDRHTIVTLYYLDHGRRVRWGHIYLLYNVDTKKARMRGPTLGPSGADRTQVGPMLAPWTLLSGNIRSNHRNEIIMSLPKQVWGWLKEYIYIYIYTYIYIYNATRKRFLLNINMLTFTWCKRALEQALTWNTQQR